MLKIQGLAHSFRLAGDKFDTSGRKMNLDKVMSIELVGQQVELEDGTSITVTSVMNSGFNGIAVMGRTSENASRIGYTR